MPGLFKKKLLADTLASYQIPELEDKLAVLRLRQDAITSRSLARKTETEVEQAFNDDIFKKILGYTSYPASPYTIDPKGKTQATGQKPDAILGYYDPNEDNTHANTQVVVEIKDATTPLDKSQRREGNLSPIQQGFKYKPQYTGCKRVIATNFVEIRLFKDNQLDYEIRTLEALLDPTDDYYRLKHFHYLLCADHLISPSGDSVTERLLSEIRIDQEAITKAFYRDYKQLRHRLIRDLIDRNTPRISLMTIVEKAQKIIDRLIFVHFCEDLGLLPEGKLATNVSKAREIDIAPRDMLKRYFHGVDVGSEKLGIPEGYNGGLFKTDPMLDSLVVGDEICQAFIDLGQYDFSEDLSVNILGHIFEQSISDLEEIRYALLEERNSSAASDAKQSKRKKDGIFYTPEYIVDYIVQHSLMARLREREEHHLAQLGKKSGPKTEIDAYRAYQHDLQTVKVLDPACGSGAFLVKVFDYLLAENRRVGEIVGGLWDDESIYKDILQHNIYGVDLNAESVEITKLSLWLKTAKKGKKLASLDSNIRCGNSLIDDPTVAGDKAFIWEQEFADIMSAGGFDVIVGNPPYGAGFSEVEFDYFNNNYETSEYKIETYSLFLELGKRVLGKDGILSFIIPYTFLAGKYFSKIRGFLREKIDLDYLVLLGKSIFGDADVDTLIIQFRNQKSDNRFHRLDLRSLDYDGRIMHLLDISLFNSGLISSTGTEEIIVADASVVSLLEKIGTYPNITKFVDFYHGLQTKGDSTAISPNSLSENYYEIIKGGDFNRYSLTPFRKYINFIPDNIKSGGNLEKYLVEEKLIMRTTGDYFVTSYDANQYICLNSVNVILPLHDSGLSLKYILTILNSSLQKFWYQSVVQETGKTFAEVKISYLKKISIPFVSFEEQQPFVERADQMLELHRQLHEQTQGALSLLQERYSLEKISRALEKFRELDFAELKKALKVKNLSLTDEEELLAWFTHKKTSLQSLQSQIDSLDREIDEMVFDLYGLTEEERRVVEGR